MIFYLQGFFLYGIFSEEFTRNNHKEVFDMAYKISDACVNCGACEGECPVGAISENNGKREVNPDVCVSCGTCASACPTGAIVEA
jgi:ferredoxin